MKKRYIIPALFGVFTGLSASGQAWAQTGVEDIAKNITSSSASMPGLVSAFMYLAGIILVITGLLKLKEHIDNERQTPIRTPIIRLIAGGLCFAFPLILDVVRRTINAGNNDAFDDHGTMIGSLNGILTTIYAVASFGTNFNALLVNIVIFSNELPGLVTALSYLLGVIIAASAILKLKEHVEEPEKVTIKEPVIRFLTAGALFAMPYIYKVVFATIADTGMGFWGGIVSIVNLFNFTVSSYASGNTPDCLAAAAGFGSTIGDVICMAMLSTIGLPQFLAVTSYVLGLILGVWGVLKIRDHVLSPTQTKLSEGVTRLLACGAFFAMPVVAIALQSTFMPATLAAFSKDGTAGNAAMGTDYAGTLTCGVPASLDQALGCFVDDLLEPSQTVLNFFCFVAALILTMIGISRLTKSAQDGPRGPGGLGTVATFVTAGILMSGTSFMAAMSSSLFGGFGDTKTYGTLAFAGGMNAAEKLAAQNVVTAVIKFMIIIGLISFVRGVFILRDTAEGKSQASVMSAMTHIIGGALAVNLGPLLNAVQTTLGVSAFGVTFS